MTKIVLFSDGTANSSSSPQKTNVWRSYQALDCTPGSGQIAFYDNGVGTSAFTPTAILGLAFGFGLARNVRQIYGFLCRTYEIGDEIYGFGFSRGAFTMRVVIALIASQGIIDRNQVDDERDLDRLIVAAYRKFRKDNFTPSMLSFFLQPVRDFLVFAWHTLRGREPYNPKFNIRNRALKGEQPLIKFVGVWDSVDAYGLPIDELTRAWDKVVWPLMPTDRDLSPRVARACHALALDEQRKSFEPMLWNEHGVKRNDGRLHQVWFAGVHSNVGGGYPDDTLALIALNWMLDESSRKGGLKYISEVLKSFAIQSSGPAHDSRSGVGNLYRYAPRNLDRLCRDEKPGLWNWFKEKLGQSRVQRNEVNIVKPKIHHSVFDRIAEGGDAYAPINVPKDYAVIDQKGVAKTASTGFETKKEAADRRVRQSYVWNKVWLRKRLYALTLLCIIGFVLFPYLDDESIKSLSVGDITSIAESFLGTLSVPISAIPGLIGKIPGFGFAESWAAHYGNFPYVFFFGLLAISGLLLWSLKVNAALKAEMRANWRHAAGGGNEPPASVSAFRKSLARFLEGPTYTGKISRFKSIGSESLAVLLFLLAVLAVASRLFLVAADGFGNVCQPAQEGEAKDQEGKVIDFGAAFSFDPTKPCFPTGLAMIAGEKYAIEFQVSNDWRDATLEADVNGWRSAPWYMYLFTPIRRHLFAGWYQPIARIDNKLFDRYPLRASKRQPDANNGTNKLVMNFTARRSGELYLYLNDAVLFTPDLVKRFYANNNGQADVTVHELQ